MKTVKVGVNVEELQRRYHYLKRHTSKDPATEDEEDFNPLEDDESDDWSARQNQGYSCLYLGSVNVGDTGEVRSCRENNEGNQRLSFV